MDSILFRRINNEQRGLKTYTHTCAERPLFKYIFAKKYEKWKYIIIDLYDD